MAEIGWATLGVIPSFRDFGGALERGTSKSMATAGIAGGARFGDQAGRSAGRTFSSRFSTGIKTIGLFGGIGAAIGIGDFIRDSVQLEADFGRTMAQIRVATDAPADSMQRLDDLAIRLGKDTIFSASDASEAMLELAKNGIRPATIEAGALDSALTLAAAGGVDMESAATTMGNALNAFGLKGRQARSVAAALAGAANSSSASVGSLAEGLQQSATSANDMGFTVQETAGALAAFANAGISGSDAGTSLKTMLSRLVPQTDKAQKAMNALGLDFTNSNGEILSMSEVAGQLQAKLGDLSTEERSTALNTIFGSDARRASTVLMKEGAEGLRDYIKATSDQGAAERMAKANMEGTAGSIERLKGAWETTKLEFGKSISPVAADFLDWLAGKLDDLAPKLTDFGEWFTDEGVPKIKRFAGFMKDDVLPVVKDLGEFAKDAADFLNDLPKEVKIGGLATLAALFAGAKVRGGGGGILGTAGSAFGLTKPIKVFETNPAALGGGGGGAGGAVKKAPLAAVGTVGLAGVAAITIGSLGSLAVNKLQEKVAPKAFDKGISGTPNTGIAFAGEDHILGINDDDAKKKIEALVDSVDRFKGSLDLVGAKKVNPDLRIPNIMQEQNRLGSFASKLDLVGSTKIRPNLQITGIDHARSQVDDLLDSLDAVAAVDITGLSGLVAVGASAAARGRGGGRPRNAGRDRNRERNLGGHP